MNAPDPGKDELERLSSSAEFVAGDAFRLIRVNLVLVGLYASTIVFIAQNTNVSFRQSFVHSTYTQASIILWLMSTLAAYLTYESAGRLAAVYMYDKPLEVLEKYTSTERLVFNIRYAMGLSLLSGASFLIGVLDGGLPTGIGLGLIGELMYGLLLLTAIPVLSAWAGLRLWDRVPSLRS